MLVQIHDEVSSPQETRAKIGKRSSDLSSERNLCGRDAGMILAEIKGSDATNL
jgi:hypothetical protein